MINQQLHHAHDELDLIDYDEPIFHEYSEMTFEFATIMNKYTKIKLTAFTKQ